MRQLFLAYSCLLVCVLVGCGGDMPTQNTKEPAPKTEVIKKPDGSEETRTSLPDARK